MIIHPDIIELVLEMKAAFPDANADEIAKAVEVATAKPYEDLDSPIEALIANGFPALEALLDA